MKNEITNVRPPPRDAKQRVIPLKQISGDREGGAQSRRLIINTADSDSYFTEFPLKEDFDDLAQEYIVADGEWRMARDIGEALCKSKLVHLARVRIGYLWKQHGGSRGGKAVMGKAVKTSALVSTFTDRLGFVVLSADHVQTFKLNRWQMEALIYHELMHFHIEEDGALATHGHDFEAFRQEVEEYGLWKPDLALAAETFKQGILPGFDGLNGARGD